MTIANLDLPVIIMLGHLTHTLFNVCHYLYTNRVHMDCLHGVASPNNF